MYGVSLRRTMPNARIYTRRSSGQSGGRQIPKHCAKSNVKLMAPTLYNSFPWFVRIRTWPSGIDSSLRQKWPSISITPGFRSQRGRSDELAKFEAQKSCIPFDAGEFQEPDGRLGEYSFKLEIVIGSTKSVKHEMG